MVGWGQPADVLLHDRALLAEGATVTEPVGFTYWDAAHSASEDVVNLEAWLREGSSDPTLLVTMGSLIGVVSRDAWLDLVGVIQDLGVRAAFVGMRKGWAQRELEVRPGLIAVGYVPLSRYLGQFDAAVHHGGLGTTFACLRAGVPAVVDPQAFDQPFNGRLLQAVGAGVLTVGAGFRPDVEQVLSNGSIRVEARRVGLSLIDPVDAAEAAVSAILSLAAK